MADIRLFGGLGSGAFERYQEGIENLQERIGGTVYFSLSGYSDWTEVSAEILALEKAGKLSRPLVLIGHSNGVYAILKIAQRLAENGVAVDYLASIDKHIDVIFPIPVVSPPAGPNIKLLHDFWAGLSKVTIGDDFVGKAGLFDLDKLDAENVSHVEAANHPFVHDTIAKTVAELTGETTTTEPDMADYTKFNHWTPILMARLMADFTLSVEDAAAVFGNAGHESIGYTTFQEINPIVPGSRGGAYMMMWTASRRREYEAYCDRNGYDPADMDVNYKWLFVELKGSEKRVLPLLKAAAGLEAKTKVFSDTFLRPGIPHMNSRYVWARRAMEAWNNRPVEPQIPVPAPVNTCLLAFGSNDWDAPEDAARAVRTAIQLSQLAGFRVVYVPPSPTDARILNVSTLCTLMAEDMGVHVDTVQDWAADKIHPTATEYQRIAGTYPGALVFGDSFAVGIMAYMKNEHPDSWGKEGAKSAAVLAQIKASAAIGNPQVPNTPQPPVTLPEPSLPDMTAVRDHLLEVFTHLTPKDVEERLLDLYLERWRPAGDIAETSPALERGSFLPEPETKGTEMATEADAKAWYLSRGVVGSIASLAAAILYAITGIEVDQSMQSQVVEIILVLLGGGGGTLSLIGRLLAKHPIG